LGVSDLLFEISKAKSAIKKITIDESGLMADVKRNNNIYPEPQPEPKK
jgi:hypothetical protein